MTKDDNKKPDEKEPSFAKASSFTKVSTFAKASADKSADKSEGKEIKEGKGNEEELKKQRDEYLAGWQRARADFLNYKKEEMERIGELIKYSNEEIILKILPILDNFELAARQNFLSENLGGQEKNNQVIDGFLQIKKQIQEFLKQQGIEEIEAMGTKFNPNLHEAVEEVEAQGKEHGIIVEEIQKGYKLYNKVIRPAKVRITK